MKKTKLLIFTLMAFLVVGFAVNVNADEPTNVATYDELIAANVDNASIKLTDNITLTDNLFVKNLSLDLNGYTLETNGKAIVSQGKTTVKDTSSDETGKIENSINGTQIIQTSGSDCNFILESGTIKGGRYVIYNYQGKVTMNGGKIVTTEYALFANTDTVFEMNDGKIISNSEKLSNTINVKQAKIIINGGEISAPNAYGIVAWHDSDITINGGKINSRSFAITGNGTIGGSNDGSNAKFTITGGTLISDKGAAIYAPQANGETKITGGNLTGLTSAIEIRAGKLTISDGTFKASTDHNGVDPNGNGTTTHGVAVAVAQHTTQQPIDVKITGGNFNAYVALKESNPQNNSEEAISKVNISVTGGKFNATSDDVVYSQDLTKFISGGEYNTAPNAKYIADDYSSYKVDSNKNLVEKTIKSISLNKTEETLIVGKTLQVKPSVNPNSSSTGYTYTSSNAKVAKVDKNGTITALSNGTAIVTVSSTYDKTKTATIKVTVNTDIAKATVTGIVNKVYNKHNQYQKNIVVKLSGKTLKNGTDYKISYKNNKNIGKATLTITGKGNYKGTITRTFKIDPVKIAIKKFKKSGNSFRVYYYAPAGGVKYQVAYKQKNNKTWKYVKTSKTNVVARYLKKNMKYYVKVRAYKVVNGQTYYGAWSNTKTVKIKR